MLAAPHSCTNFVFPMIIVAKYAEVDREFQGMQIGHYHTHTPTFRLNIAHITHTHTHTHTHTRTHAPAFRLYTHMHTLPLSSPLHSEVLNAQQQAAAQPAAAQQGQGAIEIIKYGACRNRFRDY